MSRIDLYKDWCHLDERIDTVTGEIEELSASRLNASG